MPGLFRIMGGQNPRSSNNSISSGTTASNSSAQSPVVNSRYTYPGHRSSVTNTAPNPGISGPDPTTTTPPVGDLQPPTQETVPVPEPQPAQQPQATPQPQPQPPTATSNTVVRGSQVKGLAEPTRPGAYQVTRTTSGPAQVYRVTVPQGVRPGAEFTVHAGPRRVRVRCPPTSRPGQSLQITLPPEPVTSHVMLRMAPLTAADGAGGGGAVPMTEDVRKVNEQAEASGGTAQTFLVDIPPDVYPGMQFTVNLSGQKFMVTCPPSAQPGMKVRIVPPVKQEEPEAAPRTQVFEVAVPSGVEPGQPFALMANGQRVLVTCPPNVVPGQRIRFQLPVSQVVGNIQLSYESEKGGWRRTIRVTDFKFQWVRLESEKMNQSQSKIDIEGMENFDFRRSAYVRKITYMEGNDARMRTGKVELVPANDAVVDSKLVIYNRTLLSYADIAAMQGKPLEEKTVWFEKLCSQLTSAWEDGHIKLIVRRKYLLLDSVDAVMSLGREDLRKRWRIEFLGEPGIDAGGVAREWFQLVTEQIFDPDFGLWLSSLNNQLCMNINPASAVSCPEDHLVYFRFLGRVIGRALFDRQLIKGHMIRTIYKHLLGWPVTFDDIQSLDEEYYQSLKKLTKMTSEELENMCLAFTVTEDILGARHDLDLVPDGSMKDVNIENLSQYLEANLQYRMLGKMKEQLTELMLGFFDIIPEPALTVFDANELELILCGLPEIDMDDWKANTKYSGSLHAEGKKSKVVQWFWDIVEFDFDQEMKARLLQFVTGTSGVPARGFSVLQGVDGNIKKFTIHGVDYKTYKFPRAHTCFNRIDLPLYSTKEEMREKLQAAITQSGVGFDME